jgi:hypothetical protein
LRLLEIASQATDRQTDRLSHLSHHPLLGGETNGKPLEAGFDFSARLASLALVSGRHRHFCVVGLSILSMSPSFSWSCRRSPSPSRLASSYLLYFFRPAASLPPPSLLTPSPERSCILVTRRPPQVPKRPDSPFQRLLHCLLVACTDFLGAGRLAWKAWL